MKMNRIAITCGDINGIGVEITLKALNKLRNIKDTKFIFIVPENIFNKCVKRLPPSFPPNFTTEFLPSVSQISGQPTKTSGKTSYEAILKAHSLIANGKADAMVTAPISKEALALAGIPYKGHTKLLADLDNTDKYLMTFVSPSFKTALATIHIPLKEVHNHITTENIEEKLNVLIRSARIDFGIDLPRIAVLGLNPHAGENGTIGTEEKEILTPIIESWNREDAILQGPFVSDAFFGKKLYNEFDFVLGMYHDQVLIPFKMLNFDNGINFTAGLSFVRTSPDHGTAFDIAGKGIANETSMFNAIKLAIEISSRRNAK